MAGRPTEYDPDEISRALLDHQSVRDAAVALGCATHTIMSAQRRGLLAVECTSRRWLPVELAQLVEEVADLLMSEDADRGAKKIREILP